jgi:prepilin signal peptidase PulO-like enzyme (type II secretory pathway)
MEYFLGGMIFLMGAALGSFVNMLVYRTAYKYNLIKTKKFLISKNKERRSFCDYCGRQLRWWENLPIFSWIFLRGRSKCCDNPLPWQYPVVELVMGLLAVAGFWFLKEAVGINVIFLGQMGYFLAITTLLMFLLVFDLKYMILPDFGVFMLIGLALIGVIFDEVNIIPYLLSAAGGFLFLGGIHWLTKGRGMGFGDAKLAIFMGLFLGWSKIVVAFYVAFITGAVVGLMMILLRKAGRRSQIAFGPFLIIGTGVAWGWGGEIVKSLISKF